jgi:hypothetical protein
MSHVTWRFRQAARLVAALAVAVFASQSVLGVASGRAFDSERASQAELNPDALPAPVAVDVRQVRFDAGSYESNAVERVGATQLLDYPTQSFLSELSESALASHSPRLLLAKLQI